MAFSLFGPLYTIFEKWVKIDKQIHNKLYFNMEKNTSALLSMGKIKVILSILFISAVLLAAVFLSARFSADTNAYRIENKYYGFEIEMPKGWFAEGKTLYSEDNIAQLLQACQDNKASGTSSYEVGHFKFKSQKYPQNFDQALYSASKFPSGIIIDITANCISSLTGEKNAGYGYGDINIGGENAIAGISDYPGSGGIESLTFLHDGLQYVISEYIYISPDNKGVEEKKLTTEYSRVFNKAISTFKFMK